MPFAVGLSLVLLASHPADWESQWKRARALTANLDFETALPLLKALSADLEIPPGPRVEVLIELGIAQVNLGNNEAAKVAFARALEFDPGATLPRLAPPKAQQLFESVRPARAATASVVAPTVTTPQVVAAPTPPMQLQQPQTVSRVPWAGIAVGGLSVATLVAGVALSLESPRVAASLATTPRPRADVEAALSLRTGLAAGGVSAYVISAALATLTAALFLDSLAKPTVALHFGPGEVGVVSSVRF